MGLNYEYHVSGGGYWHIPKAYEPQFPYVYTKIIRHIAVSNESL